MGPSAAVADIRNAVRASLADLTAGDVVLVACSGGADSLALAAALAFAGPRLGLRCGAVTVDHGLQPGSDERAAAIAGLLVDWKFDPVYNIAVTVADTGGPEAAARAARYRALDEVARRPPRDTDGQPATAVLLGHTLDDQAETVLAKFLRGAWTEGLSGIHPRLEGPEGGLIVRPFLRATRTEIEAFLHAHKQAWREDSSNRHLTFTRNRIRHELLPHLETWNPQLREHLGQMAELARDEESWWQPEIDRVASQVLVRGRPVRGGGRATTGVEGVALDLARLNAEPVAIQRRLLRHAAGQLGSAPDFAATESLRSLALAGKGGQKLELAGGLRAERTHREIRLSCGPAAVPADLGQQPERYECVIPGEVSAPSFGCRIRLDLDGSDRLGPETEPQSMKAVLRSWKPGDRVRLRYSSGPRKIKEVLERMRVTGADRIHWPVLEVDGRILWMRGAEVEPDPAIRVSVEALTP